MSVNKLFYACGGNADLISSYRHWKDGIHDPHEVSITFSGQTLDYCRDAGAVIYMLSPRDGDEIYQDDGMVIEHKAKPTFAFLGSALSYHLGEVIYGFMMLWRALRFRADVALVDSGATHYFMLFLFRLFGIKVVSILHNTLWPSGFPPKKWPDRVIKWCDKWFFRYGANAITGVSKECEIQLVQLCGQSVAKKYMPFRAQFNKAYFDLIAPPPEHEQRPFKTLFIGRVAEFKGVFDILKMADCLKQKHPGQFEWVICGTGPALVDLQAKATELGLNDVVTIPGWVALEELIEHYRDCHISIIPTTDGFNEGLAMTAAESVLSGRPFIASGVVPAAGEMPTACYQATTNDIDSFVDGIEKMAFDKAFYNTMKAACSEEGKQFLNRELGLTATLHRLIPTL